MEIIKIINNNILSSVDESGNEIIVTGRGIGFKKKIGEQISDEAVEKIYSMKSKTSLNKLQALVAEIPFEHMQICSKLIDYFNKNLRSKLNENILITLTDHVSFAIERLAKGISCPNTMFTEIKRYYPEEYLLGRYAVEYINNQLECTLPDDEAGFIALHIVNAELDTSMSDMFHITEMIDKAVDITRKFSHNGFDDKSVYFDRFIVHLKFLGQRIFRNLPQTDRDHDFQKVIRKSCPEETKCATLIEKMLAKDYGKQISGEEKTYLTIHLKRINFNDE